MMSVKLSSLPQATACWQLFTVPWPKRSEDTQGLSLIQHRSQLSGMSVSSEQATQPDNRPEGQVLTHTAMSPRTSAHPCWGTADEPVAYQQEHHKWQSGLQLNGGGGVKIKYLL